jgi:hyperosmotically inducible protein
MLPKAQFPENFPRDFASFRAGNGTGRAGSKDVTAGKEVRIMKRLLAFAIVAVLVGGAVDLLFSGPQKPSTQQVRTLAPRPNADRSRDDRAKAVIGEHVRHELALLPYYGVFDWIEAQVVPNDTVILRGQVIRPTTKSDAEYRVKKVESVAKVVNQIEVLPLSPSDDEARIAIYRAIFDYNGPLFRYSTSSRPSIHIIVKNGRATLKGVVASDADRQIAYTKARGVPFLFDVKNELQVVNG